MNLVLDYGNTRVKAGVFDASRLVETAVFDSADAVLEATLLDNNISKCMVASVTLTHSNVVDQLHARFPTRLFTTDMRVPVINKYTSALSLGSDRLAVAVGAFSLYPDQNVLSIDAGTCIKYNFVNAQNEYLGGAISPGLSMRLKAMHEHTYALPQVEPDFNYTELLGRNTRESLLSGSLVAAACEADEMINRYRDRYPDLVVVLTGGDSTYLSAQLKSRFFANQNLVLIGLNTILNYV